MMGVKCFSHQMSDIISSAEYITDCTYKH